LQSIWPEAPSPRIYFSSPFFKSLWNQGRYSSTAMPVSLLLLLFKFLFSVQYQTQHQLHNIPSY
jgi:hypothetical protein